MKVFTHREGRHATISSMRLEETPGHDLVHVWNHGGKAGILTVNKGDGQKLINRLSGGEEYLESSL